MQAISIQVSLESEGIWIRILNIRDANARYCRDMDDKQQVKHEQLIGARNCLVAAVMEMHVFSAAVMLHSLMQP